MGTSKMFGADSDPPLLWKSPVSPPEGHVMLCVYVLHYEIDSRLHKRYLISRYRMVVEVPSEPRLLRRWKEKFAVYKWLSINGPFPEVIQ